MEWHDPHSQNPTACTKDHLRSLASWNRPHGLMLDSKGLNTTHNTNISDFHHVDQ